MLSGGEAALLLELQGKPDGEAALLLDMPARFSPWYYELTEQSRQAHIARTHLYADLFGRGQRIRLHPHRAACTRVVSLTDD